MDQVACYLSQRIPIKSPPKIRGALMIPCNIGTLYADVGVIGQVCFDDAGAGVRLRKRSNRSSRTEEIRVAKRLVTLVLSLAFAERLLGRSGNRMDDRYSPRHGYC
jgi:hypothetical protein